jgi:hypothetical protein
MLGQLDEGLIHLQDGLDLAHDTAAAPSVLYGVGTYAVLLAKQSQHEKAATLLAFVLADSRLQMDDRAEFQRLVTVFGYDETMMQTAQTQIASLTLDVIVAEIINYKQHE